MAGATFVTSHSKSRTFREVNFAGYGALVPGFG